MPNTIVSQKRFDHHFGNGLLYSSRSPSQTWPVTSDLSIAAVVTVPFGALTLTLPVAHNNHAQAAIDATTSTVT